jgi:hypothetical protein
MSVVKLHPLEMLNYKSAAFSACPGPAFPLRGAAAPVKPFELLLIRLLFVSI